MQERVTRNDVEERWLRATLGGASRREAAAWAERKLDNSPDCEELVLEGLLHLQALIHQPTASSEEIKAALRSWRRELDVHDRDPAAWTRNYFVTVLEHFAQQHGPERVHEFATKLHADGAITDADLRPFAPHRA